MGAFSIWHLGLIALVVLVLFGGNGKLSRIMGDFGKGITSFKAGLREGDKREADASPESINNTLPAGKLIEGNAVPQGDPVRR